MKFALSSLFLACAFLSSAVAQSRNTEVDHPAIQARPRLEEAEVAPPERSAPNVPASLGRPILFVHGCGGDDTGWQAALEAISANLRITRPDLYSENSAYGAIFDGTHVFFYDFYTFQFMNSSQISKNARFFTILFFDPRQSSLSAAIDKANVWNIAIAVKGNEIAEVIAAIQDVTLLKDVNVVAHSMGGLAARAYIESLAGPIASIPGTACTYGLCYSYAPGATPFQNDIGSLITVDTPHNGAPRLKLEQFAIDTGFTSSLPCQGVNRTEMVPTDSGNIIGVLNYVPGVLLGQVGPKSIPSTVSIQSIKSYNNHDWNGDPNSDGILYADTQDIRQTLQPNIPIGTNIITIDNSFGDTFLSDAACQQSIVILSEYILHPIECVGAQQQTVTKILAGIDADMLGVPLGVFSISAPSSVLGGIGVSATVTLTTGAPVHGAQVQLSSDDPALQVPSSTTLSAGASIANFSITTSAVGSPKAIHLTAGYGRVNQVATITLLPAQAQVQFSGSSLNFSTELLNLRSAGRQVLLTNSGTLAMSISSISVSGDFEESNNCPATLATSASCQINVVFHPHGLGAKSGTLMVADNAPGSPHTVGLTGTGFDIALSVPRASRRNRAAAGSGSASKRELIVELNTVGGNPTAPLQAVCLSAGCDMKQTADANSWIVTVVDRRASRLTGRSRIVVIQATTGASVRNIQLPID